MATPLQFMTRYRNLHVAVPFEDPVQRVTRPISATVQLRNYFMMSWNAGTEELKDYNDVTSGSGNDAWFKANKEQIRNAAMGKGAPRDYELALEWAVRSGHIPVPTQESVQKYCDEHLGIDCSGFVTNYLAACGKRGNASTIVRNTSAASYFQAHSAVNDLTAVRQGDLLVWMNGASVLTSPGHVAVVESYWAQSRAGGNMRVVEATGAGGAYPKLLDSMYTVERIEPKSATTPMILVVQRHGISGNRVAVIRP
jgi:hypothetical protein